MGRTLPKLIGKKGPWIERLNGKVRGGKAALKRASHLGGEEGQDLPRNPS